MEADCTEKVKLESGLQEIGNSAFKNCPSLETIEFPDTLTTINANAFNGCTALQSVKIPASVTSVANAMFTNCTQLKSAEIYSSVVPVSAFSGCTNLESVVLGDQVTTIGIFLIFQWEHIGRWNGYVKWIRYLLLPFAFVIDIIFLIIRVLIYTVIWYSIGYICILIRLIKKTLDKLSNWISDLSDKRIVAISFRIALIMALVCIVVMNRYQPIFKEQEARTAVLEFVASAIIIPVIFEWINSAKNNHQEEG